VKTFEDSCLKVSSKSGRYSISSQPSTALDQASSTVRLACPPLAILAIGSTAVI